MNTWKSRNLVSILAVMFLFLLFSTETQAMEEELPDAMIVVTYKVIDAIQKKETFQELKILLFSEPSSRYTVERKDALSKKVISTEKEDYWRKVTHAPGQSYYALQSLNENVGAVTRNGTVFGRIEIRTIKDDTIISAWPVFGTIVKRGDIYTSTLTAYIPSSGKVIFTDIYQENQHYVPLYKRQQQFGLQGELLSDVLFARM